MRYILSFGLILGLSGSLRVDVDFVSRWNVWCLRWLFLVLEVVFLLLSDVPFPNWLALYYVIGSVVDLVIFCVYPVLQIEACQVLLFEAHASCASNRSHSTHTSHVLCRCVEGMLGIPRVF